MHGDDNITFTVTRFVISSQTIHQFIYGLSTSLSKAKVVAVHAMKTNGGGGGGVKYTTTHSQPRH
jgi:hypothetical protein